MAPEQQAHLARLSPDLRFHLDQANVESRWQARFGELGIISVPLFAGLDETREKIRAALAADLPLNFEESVAKRLEMARLLSAWEAVKLHLEVSEKNRAESRLGTQQRLVQPSEQHGMRVAVEAILGKLKDREVPSRSMLAAKLEQIESNQPVVESLQEVSSLEDSELESYSAVIDPVTNVLKVKPGKTLSSLPQTPEDLRLRHRRIGLSWDFLATKHSSRTWLSKNLTDTFRRFSDYVLGSQVAGLQSGDGRKPTWSLVLQFEHEARKAAYKWLRDGDVNTLEEAFSRAMVDTEILQRHLIIPFSLNITARSHDDMPNSWVERPGRGRGKGRGTGGGKGSSGKGARNQHLKNSHQDVPEPKGKLAKDANGDPICWRFNRKGGCSNEQCRFKHVCQRCLSGAHAYYNCPLVKRSSGAN